MKDGKVYKGALFLGVGAIIVKLLGAIYRIPLTNVLGGEGLGLYQAIFPIYTILLDFSGLGVPAALSLIIAKRQGENQNYNPRQILQSSIRVLFTVGGVGTLLMACLFSVISSLQGNINARFGYLFLAPSVLAVSLISCFRGYFQGKLNMFPTALSQVIEQVVKIAVGLFLAFLFMPNVPLAVGGATLGITVSEIVSLAYLFIRYKIATKKDGSFVFDKGLLNSDVKILIITVIPVVLTGIAIPLTHLIDSFLVVNILSKYRTDATTLFGLFSGASAALINLPVAVCYGIATTTIPSLGKEKSVSKSQIAKPLLITLVISLICGIALYFLSEFAVNILYGRLSIEEKEITVKIIKYSAINVVFLSLIQTGNAVLIGKREGYFALIGAVISVAVKVPIEIILLNRAEFNVYGAVISQIACYFCWVIVNFIVIARRVKKNANKAVKLKRVYD